MLKIKDSVFDPFVAQKSPTSRSLTSPKIIEQGFNAIEKMVVNSTITAIHRNLAATIGANLKTLKQGKIPQFYFSTALSTHVMMIWNLGWSLALKHTQKELSVVNFNECPIDLTAEFADEASELLKQNKQQVSIEDLQGNIDNANAIIQISEARKAQYEAQLRDLGFENSTQAYAALRSRDTDADLKNQIDPIITEIRGHNLDIQDANAVLVKSQRQLNKLNKVNKVVENTPSIKVTKANNSATDEEPSSIETSNKPKLKTKLQSDLIKKQSENTPNHNPADQVKQVRLQQQYLSALTAEQNPQINLAGTDYANVYLNARTNDLGKIKSEQLNQIYKQAVSNYLNEIKRRTGNTTNLDEQKLLRDLTGQTDNRKVVSRINELLKNANVPSKTGVNTQKSLEELQDERDRFALDQIYPLKHTSSDPEDRGGTIDVLEDNIRNLNRLSRKRDLTANEKINFDTYTRQLAEEQLALKQAQTRLKQLNRQVADVKNNGTGRNLNRLITLTDADKQLLNTNKDQLSVAELDELRRANQVSGQTVDPKVLNQIKKIAATEVALAYNVGRISAFKQYQKQTGQEVCVEWMNELEGNTPCAYCVSRANSVLSVNEILTQGGIKQANEYVIPAHPNCVTGDTLVTLADGISTKYIKDIRVGDLVYTATDEKYQRVYATQKTKISKNILEITLENGRTIRGTKDHKVWSGRVMRSLSSYSEGEEFTVLGRVGIEESRVLKKSLSNLQDSESNYCRNNRNVRDEISKSYGSVESSNTLLIHSKKKSGIDFKSWRANNRSLRESKKGLYRSRRDYWSKKRFDSEGTNAHEHSPSFNSLSMDRRGRSQKANCKNDERNSVNSTITEPSFQRLLQRRFKSIFPFNLGSKFCTISQLSKCKLVVRTKKICTQQRIDLYSRFLFTQTRSLYRSERLLERRCPREVCEIQGGIPVDKNFRFRWQEVQYNNQIFSTVNKLRIVNIKEIYWDDYVYDISVERDEVFFANGILVKNCKCHWQISSCSRKNRKVPYKSIAAFVGGGILATLSVAGAYSALNRLRKPIQGNIREEIKNRVYQAEVGVGTVLAAREVLRPPLTPNVAEGETVNLQPLPLIQRAAMGQNSPDIEQGLQARNEFISTAYSVLTNERSGGKTFQQILEERITTIQPSLRNNYTAFNELTSLANRIENQYTTFETQAAAILAERKAIDANRRLNAADKAAANAQLQARIAAIQPSHQAFIDEINNISFNSRMARSEANSHLTSAISGVDAASFVVKNASITDETLGYNLNNYRQYETKASNFEPTLEIPEISELNQLGLNANLFIRQYDSIAPETFAQINDYKDSLTDLTYQLGSAGVNKTQFVKERLAAIRTQAQALNVNRVVSDLNVGKTKDLNLQLARLEAQLQGVALLPKTNAIQPSYDYFINEINKISKFVSDKKALFPTDPNFIDGEIVIMLPYSLGDINLARSIDKVRREKIEPAKQLYNSLSALEARLNVFSDTLEIKPRLKTVDRIRDQFGLSLTKEEYLSQIGNELQELKAIRANKRTAAQNSRIDELTIELVRSNRAEFKRKNKIKFMSEFIQ